MASSSAPRIQVYKCDAALAVGRCVKRGTDDNHMAVSTSATDKIVGIGQTLTTAAEDLLEVAINGGGAKALLGGTVAFGDLLTSDGAGALITTTTGDNRVVAIAMQAGVSGDLIGVEVAISNV